MSKLLFMNKALNHTTNQFIEKLWFIQEKNRGGCESFTHPIHSEALIHSGINISVLLSEAVDDSALTLFGLIFWAVQK